MSPQKNPFCVLDTLVVDHATQAVTHLFSCSTHGSCTFCNKCPRVKTWNFLPSLSVFVIDNARDMKSNIQGFLEVLVYEKSTVTSPTLQDLEKSDLPAEHERLAMQASALVKQCSDSLMDVFY